MPAVLGTVFVKPGQYGDFAWMIKQPEYDNCLFIFNDNVEYHNSPMKGAGNAAVRPYNRHSKLQKPLSAGVPTGTMKYGGFTSLSVRNVSAPFPKGVGRTAKDIINASFAEIAELIKKHNYDIVFFSSDDTHRRLGTSIFVVGDDVIDYVTEQIWKLDTSTDGL